MCQNSVLSQIFNQDLNYFLSSGGDRCRQGRSSATRGHSGRYLGCCPCPWSGRLDPVSSHFPWVLGAGRRWRQHEPAGERARGGAAGAAGEGGKAHPAGTRGRTAAAWRSSLGCPAWSPRPGTLFEPEVVPQRERPAAAASSDRRLCRAVACTLREAPREVGNLIARSTGWEAAAASWPGGPSYAPEPGAGARAPAPWAPSPPAPRQPGQWGRGCHSTGLGVRGSGTCRACTCVLGGPPSPPAASPGARCAAVGGRPAGTEPVGRWRRVGGRPRAPAAGSPAGGPAQPRGQAPRTPASPECPAGARGARSVPRPAEERGRGVSATAMAPAAPGMLHPFGRRGLPAWQSAGAVGPGLRDGARALAESRTVWWGRIHAKGQRLLAPLVSEGWGGVQGGRNKTICEVHKSSRNTAGEGKPRLE